MGIRSFAFCFLALIGTIGPCLSETTDGSQEIIPASQVAGIEIVRLSKLPSNPNPDADGGLCENHTSAPSGKEAVEVQSQGWIITGEARLGNLQAVSFVSGVEPGTSGSCRLKDGNIAFYRNGKLVALAYASKDSRISIGHIEAIGTNVRIWEGDWVQMPVGDIMAIGTQGIVARPLPAEEKFCDEQVTVPNLYQLPIRLARELVIGNGWLPKPGPADADIRAQNLRDSGITEVETCSGTGFGYCSYEYQNGERHLSVTTVGDSPDTPSVIWYDVGCTEK